MPTEGVATCKHTTTIEDETVKCGREIARDEEKCLLHRSREEKGSHEALKQFVDEIEDAPANRPIAADEDRPCFAGAKFGPIEFRDTQLASECSFRLDLRDVEARKINLIASEVVRTLDLSASNVVGDLNVQNSVFNSELVCEGVTVGGSLDLTDAEFERPVVLRDLEADGDLVLEGATFHAGLECDDVTISGNLRMDGAEFGDRASFRGATVIGDVSAEDAAFREGLNLAEAELAELSRLDNDINFSGADFSGPVNLSELEAHNRLLLDDIYLDDRVWIDGSGIDGDVTVRSSNIETIEIASSDIAGSLRIESSTVDDVQMRNLDSKVVQFNKVAIDSLHIDGCDIDEAVILEECITTRQADLKETRIGQSLRVADSRFNSQVKMAELQVEGPTSIKNVWLNDGFSLHKGEYGGEIDLGDSKFEGTVTLRDFIAHALDISDTQFRGSFLAKGLFLSHGSCKAEHTRFHGECALEGVRTVTKIEAPNARFGESLSIENGRAAIGISLAEATIEEELLVENVETPEAGSIEIDLAGAEIKSGKIVRTDEPLYDVDLTSTTLGDVSFESGDGRIFEHLRCSSTQFTEFDFSDYHAELRDEDWKIHDPAIDEEIPTVEQSPPKNNGLLRLVWYVIGPIISTLKTRRAGKRIGRQERQMGSEPDEQTDDGDEADRDEQLDPADLGGTSRRRVEGDPRLGDDETFNPPADRADVENLQTTYLKAKNGANRVGAKKIASEFFRREMHYRQVLHVMDRSTSRFWWSARWSENTLLRLTSGYGERPGRVLVSAASTIVVFSFVFLFFQPAPVSGPIDALLVSLGSFATLVFSTTPQFASQTAQVIAMFEALLGAVFAALLVFTLTRSVHR